MRKHWKYIIWVLPLLGAILGYFWADIEFKGILKTWRQAGNPSEKVVKILGIRDGRAVLVESEAGSIYSLLFWNGEKARVTQPLQWEKELSASVDRPGKLHYYGADFVTLPPPFQIQQLYEHEYLYRVEGKGEVKFALDPYGNIWVWSHEIAGLTGLVYYSYPLTGFVLGLALLIILLPRVFLSVRHSLSMLTHP
jgi:hypothetical protein